MGIVVMKIRTTSCYFERKQLCPMGLKAEAHYAFGDFFAFGAFFGAAAYYSDNENHTHAYGVVANTIKPS